MSHVRPRRPAALALLLLSLLVLGSATAASALQPPSGRRANARKLLRIADGASHRLIQAGQGRLDRERAPGRSGRRSSTWMPRSTASERAPDARPVVLPGPALRHGLARRAPGHLGAGRRSRTPPSTRTSGRSPRPMAGCATGMARSGSASRPGRPLSEDERLRFARMRAEQGRLADRIEPLRDRAARAGDDATVDELTLLLAQIHAIATASPTLGDYLDASVATDSIRGAWHGARAAHTARRGGMGRGGPGGLRHHHGRGRRVRLHLRPEDGPGLELRRRGNRDPGGDRPGGRGRGEGEEISPGQVVELAPSRKVRSDGVRSEIDPDEPSRSTKAPSRGVSRSERRADPGDEAIEEEDLEVDASRRGRRSGALSRREPGVPRRRRSSRGRACRGRPRPPRTASRSAKIPPSPPPASGRRGGDVHGSFERHDQRHPVQRRRPPGGSRLRARPVLGHRARLRGARADRVRPVRDRGPL